MSEGCLMTSCHTGRAPTPNPWPHGEGTNPGPPLVMRGKGGGGPAQHEDNDDDYYDYYYHRYYYYDYYYYDYYDDYCHCYYTCAVGRRSREARRRGRGA